MCPGAGWVPASHHCVCDDPPGCLGSGYAHWNDRDQPSTKWLYAGRCLRRTHRCKKSWLLS